MTLKPMTATSAVFNTRRASRSAGLARSIALPDWDMALFDMRADPSNTRHLAASTITPTASPQRAAPCPVDTIMRNEQPRFAGVSLAAMKRRKPDGGQRARLVRYLREINRPRKPASIRAGYRIPSGGIGRGERRRFSSSVFHGGSPGCVMADFLFLGIETIETSRHDSSLLPHGCGQAFLIMLESPPTH